MTQADVHKPVSAMGTGKTNRTMMYVLVVVLLSLLAYAPIFQAGFIWDDDLFITDNQSLRTVEGLKTIWFSPIQNPQYYPLLLTVFWLQFKFFGVDPTGYHIVTLLFHIAASLAFWRLALRLAPAGAFWCGLLFALHPLNVQSVAWVTELKNTMSGFFYVLALISWDKSLSLEKDNTSGFNRHYFYALVLFIAAVLGKTPSSSWVLFALFIALYRNVSWKSWRVFARLLPMALFGVFVGLISVGIEHAGFGQGRPNVISMTEQWVSAGKSLWFYIIKFVWPADQMVVYPRWTVNAGNPLNWVPWFGAIIVMALLWVKRKTWTKGPFFCGLFYIIAVAPIQFQALGINFIFLYSYVADHFAYLPMLALLLPVSVLLAKMLNYLPKIAQKSVMVILLVSMTNLTYRHAKTFQSKEALWAHNVNLHPESGVAWMNLGYALSLRGAHEEEVLVYEQVLKMDPEFYDVYNDMGLALAALGRFDEATVKFETALEHNPGLTEAYLNLGSVLAQKGDWAGSIPLYENVLQKIPDHLPARLNLAHALRLEGRMKEAMQHAETALLQAPDSPEAWYEMGMIQVARGEKTKAGEALQQALRLNPDYSNAQKAIRDLSESR